MVKVTNGIKTISIPSGAISVYESQGFRLVKGGKSDKKTSENVISDEVIESVENASKEHGDFADEITEKPLSKWTQEEIKKFASENDIDLSGTKNADAARARIKKFFDEKAKSEM